MQLISPEFLFLASATLIFYYIMPKRLRWVVLLLSSIAFYCFSGLISLIFVSIFTLLSYLCAIILRKGNGRDGKSDVRKGKKGFYICLFSSLILTTIFMAARQITRVALLGISFYSLRVIAYIADVYRGKTAAEKNIFKYCLFVGFFPLACLGPIVLYSDVKEELYSGRGANRERVADNILRIALGIFKKIVIANALVLPLERIANNSDVYFGAYTLFLLIFYAVRVFFDFTGGIDICIGLAALLGITLPENFDRPFSATSIREFWNRWHITLGEWFERYVFYPISLSPPMQKISRLCRKKLGAEVGRRLPLYAATLFTWLLTGIWHGMKGHFITWGVINGILVLISRESDSLFSKRSVFFSVALRRVGVFLTVGAVRLLDVYRSFPLTLKMLSTVVLSPSSYISFIGSISGIISHVDLWVIFGSIIIVSLISRMAINGKRGSMCAINLCTGFLLICTMIFGTYGRGFEARDFIYSGFNGG